MDNPCKHCGKADTRTDILKCDKPCNMGKQWMKCESESLRIISEGIPDLERKGE